MADYSKEEAHDLRIAAQDIELFLRLAQMRVNHATDLPFKPQSGHSVINWLRILCVRYGSGENISDT